jgi:HEAT repeat protein
VRVAAGLALAACGTRESVPALLKALLTPDPLAAQAAATALESLTAHAEAFDAFAPLAKRDSQAANWRRFFDSNNWDAIEQQLAAQTAGPDPAARRRAVLALGHVGGDAGRQALRKFVAEEKDKKPYPPFEHDNRTDNFTFNAGSPYNPRTLQAAVRSLGHLKDTQAVPLLSEILAQNIEPKTANLFLCEAAIEALGRIGTAEAETALLETFAKLKEYWQYVGWYSDHPALYACHSSPLHYRIIEALDALGTARSGAIVPNLIRSVPTDPDRALLPENDDYENVAGRVIRRSGRGDETIETCLAILGDAQAKASAELKTAISTTAAAWGGKPGPENRASQILSLVCRDSKYEPRVREAFERFRAKPEEPIKRYLGNPNWTPVRHWTLFYLARSLGNLGDKRSVDALLAVLGPDLNEARHGRPNPSQPDIHFLQLEYTPCWRAAAAYALGCIADKKAVPALLDVAANLDNATDVRHAAATALGRIADPASFEAIRKLAQDYPEVSTRKALLQACEPLKAMAEVR